MIIYQKTPGWLIPSSERTFVTYPSGLCRVDQSYTCTTDSAPTHRATLAAGSQLASDDLPVIDGVFISKTPQEVRMQYGFTQFDVSGYGRTTTGLQSISLTQKRVVQGSVSYAVWEISGEMCILSGQLVTLEMLNIDETLLVPFDVRTGASPDSTMISIKDVSSEITRFGLLGGKTSISGNQFDLITVGPKTKTYEASMTLDGTTVSGTVRIVIPDPVISISSFRVFGKFSELDIITERLNSTTSIL